MGRLEVPHLKDYIQTTLELAREALRRSSDALRLPMTDTFLGRKTQEPFPFPQEEDSEEGGG